MSKVKTQFVIEGRNNSRRAFKEVDTQLDGINKKLGVAGKALVAAFSVSAITGALRSISTTADAYNLMNARLKLATESQDEFNTAQTELQRIAAATQAPVESLVTLYTRIARPLKEAGRSQQDILKVTEAVSMSFRISGASATEAENGVIQFAQALGAGALRGDEFNSVAEQAPRLMQALAASLGVPIGALKEMAAQGELTAAVVTDALVSQLDTLRTEAETLPETVGGAMTDLADRWNKAIGSADMQPLIDGIGSLGDTLSDPAVVENIGRLVNSLVTLAGLAAEGASGFVNIGDDIGYMAARVASGVTELDRANKEIEYWTAASEGFGVYDLMYTDAHIDKKLKAFTEYRDQLIQMQTGMADNLESVANAATEEADKRQQEELENFRGYVGELKTLQTDQVAAVKGALKEQVAAEKAAQKDIENIRNKRLEIESRYAEAIAKFGTGGGDPTYSQAQDLKVKARQSLANGDIEGAKRQAEAALKILEQLSNAGENTYGFEGFAKELRSIELAANAVEETEAEDKLKAIQQNMEALKTQAADLEALPIAFTMDDAALAKVRAQIAALAKELGQELTLPVTVSNPAASTETLPGFASGGSIRGPGTGTSDSILARLSNGEYVIKAAAVRKYGTSMLDQLNGMRLPKYADGGLVGNITPVGSGTPLNLTLEGQTFSLNGDSSTVEGLARLVRSAKLKRR